MKTVLVILLIPVVLYGAVLLFFALAQRRLQYFPTHEDAAGRGNATLRPWEGPTRAFSGYVRDVQSPERLWMVFHGNGGEALHRQWVVELATPRTAVALVEYPGYGGRRGEPSEKNILRAALEAYDALVLRYPKVPVVVLGESLGTGVAAYLAAHRPVERLALVSPYTSIEDVAAKHYPWLPVRWLLRDRYRTAEFLRQVTVPLAVIHGGDDTLIPAEFAETLVEGYGGASKLLTLLPRVGHNDIADALLSRDGAEPFRRFLRGDRL